MKITALVENTCESGKYSVEHGLSLYIETDKHKILFDMGQTELFCENAKKLGVDLGKVDFAVLSHGHYDHGGGLAKFMEINKKAPIYIHEKAFGEHYNGTEKYIGLDTKRRFGFFNDVDLSFGWGESIFRRPYNSEMRSTRTTMTKASLDFSPGVSVFVVENVSFNLSFGVFGVHFTNENQKTNGVEEGSRFSSGANFRFNLLNINFGLSVHI